MNEDNIADVQAWILGPDGTPYEGGCFRVKLVLGADFPNAPPKGYFITKIFHPNVAKTGEVCVSTLKKDWKKDLGIGHILLTIKCLLIAPNPESALNDEAGKLLLERYEDYDKRARLWTSIHATVGKTEFTKKASGEASTEPTRATVAATKTDDKSPAAAAAHPPPAVEPQDKGVLVNSNANHANVPVATPGQAVVVTKKRMASVDSSAKSKVDKKKADKKKSLRRL
ncbi:ubiquitin-conjugating enzyme 18 [Endogone sp. FLAS-F59071]|nr:ubiquitin-conjugating enzyme 18 [Endogone sp. FLAS-F59071]|eukprot:RUS15818.1 ubiquitin-conjugating enzyme 18 [Endogone sp. FLAS-F59071]